MLALFEYIPALISFSAYILALYHVRKGSFRPEPFSRFIWTMVSLLAFILLFQNGPSIISLLLTGSLFAGSVMLLISAIKYSSSAISIEDYIAVVGSVICLSVWYITNDPFYALLTLLATDAFAILPTIHNFWKKPFIEDLGFWLLLSGGSIASFFILMRQDFIDISSVITITYFASSQMLVAATIASRRLKVFQRILVKQRD